MERRWLLFFIFSFLVIQVFTIVMHKTQPPRPAPTAQQPGEVTTDTLALTTATRERLAERDEPLSPTLADTPPAARMIENSSIAIARHP
jgi:hypothetical protein